MLSLYVVYLTAIIIYFRYVNIDMGGEKTSKYSEGTLSDFLENAFSTNVNKGSIGDDMETSLCLECHDCLRQYGILVYASSKISFWYKPVQVKHSAFMVCFHVHFFCNIWK